MFFPKVEKIISEQLSNGNFRWKEKEKLYWNELRLIIPKNGLFPKIVIKFPDHDWDISEKKFVPNEQSFMIDVKLESWLYSQYMVLEGDDIKGILKELCESYWRIRSQQELRNKELDDISWARKFTKAFK